MKDIEVTVLCDGEQANIRFARPERFCDMDREFDGLYEAIPERCRRIIVDCWGIPSINEAGAGKLIALAARMRRRGGFLRLIGVEECAMEGLLRRKLDHCFSILSPPRSADAQGREIPIPG